MTIFVQWKCIIFCCFLYAVTYHAKGSYSYSEYLSHPERVTKWIALKLCAFLDNLNGFLNEQALKSSKCSSYDYNVYTQNMTTLLQYFIVCIGYIFLNALIIQSFFSHIMLCMEGLPLYLEKLLTSDSRFWVLCSNEKDLLMCPKSTSVWYGDRSFAHPVPSHWHSLPLHIRKCESLDTSKIKLKPNMSQQAFDL